MVVATVGLEAFEGDRLRRPGTAAVAFLAAWCPFCRDFETEFRRLSEEEDATFVIADASDTDSPLWERFRLEIVPTVVVFRDGLSFYRADGVPGEGLDPEAVEGIRKAVRPRPAGGRRGRSPPR
jgi:thiol-disulfide isomerase/thioredoxin